MIIYNVTSIVDESIESDYIAYMQDVFMPRVMEGGHFTACNLLKLTEPVNEGITYCAQYTTADAKELQAYKSQVLPLLETEFKQKFADRCVSFSSVLETV